jgi:predicted lipoprotein with Yx(FWY)xxD motif
VIGFSVLIAHQQQLLWWAPPGPPPQATCNLKTHVCNKAPLSVLQANKAYTATIKTAKGTIVIQLDTKDAPNSANSFIFLAEQGFYNGLDFWKVERLNQPSPETNQPSNIDLIQGGRGGDSGGPGYTVKSAATQGQYKLGVVAMANASQFFINTVDNSQAITGNSYPILGTVTSGMDVAKKIARGDKIISITITSKTIVPTPTPRATATAVATATGGGTSNVAVVKTATATVNGQSVNILTNGSGDTLYYFKSDTASSSACTGGCASTWPPVLSPGGTPTSSANLPGKLAVISDANGMQVTYNGHPLYTFASDTSAGMVTGNGVNNFFVATVNLPVLSS